MHCLWSLQQAYKVGINLPPQQMRKVRLKGVRECALGYTVGNVCNQDFIHHFPNLELEVWTATHFWKTLISPSLGSSAHLELCSPPGGMPWNRYQWKTHQKIDISISGGDRSPMDGLPMDGNPLQPGNQHTLSSLNPMEPSRGGFSVHLTLTTLCSPLLIVLSLCKDGMHAKDKQRWIVKSILPFLPPPSSIPLQRKLQRRVLSWSGIKMSSEHIVLISLILQLAAEVCISMSNFGLRENNDLLWLPFLFFLFFFC